MKEADKYQALATRRALLSRRTSTPGGFANTHTHVQAHTWGWSSLECVAPGPPGWKSHSSRALSPVRDKPGIPAGSADTAYHAAENNGAPAVQLHGALFFFTAPT